MSYSCVPLCQSDEKKKTPGLPFDEIPSAADVREKWLAVIRRDNWSQNSTSCYTKKSDHAASTAASVVLPPAVPTPQNHELEEPEPMDITDAVSDTNQRDFPPETPPACDRGVQVNSRQAVASLLATEKAKWKRKERDLRNQVSRLQRTADKYKLEFEKLQQDSIVADISYIKERAVEQQPAALFLLDQIINFRRKRPTWSEETTRRCVVLRHLSTKAYEHVRGQYVKLA
ncbi:hypothetical protein HPB50_026448 [Hyalomma asiaticum]|uniref:Uncharacterized protein n=1 Tax=Hyalomma asiaticum TaxID=266040 RepID=A0ACB7T4D0_HYAAI|nr:hypothetical protein HPB50_026448 [Hyalomma asiaticum]